MTALGIGVRVFIGWCATDWLQPGVDARAKRGVIIAGPIIHAGSKRNPFWAVDVDNYRVIDITESILTPIDDGETQETEQREEVTA